jgi:hypothetical protein
LLIQFEPQQYWAEHWLESVGAVVQMHEVVQSASLEQVSRSPLDTEPPDAEIAPPLLIKPPVVPLLPAPPLAPPTPDAPPFADGMQHVVM